MNNYKISEVSLIDILPTSLKSDPDIIAASKAVDLGFTKVVDIYNKVLIIPRIHDMESDVLDHLAYFFHVDFYDRSLSIETKRALIEQSIEIHRKKGTPRAVELLVETLFGEGQVIEWFDYGGEPYFFKVITSNPEVTTERATEFIRAVESVKNTRSRLEEIVLLSQAETTIYTATILHEGIKETFRQVNA